VRSICDRVVSEASVYPSSTNSSTTARSASAQGAHGCEAYGNWAPEAIPPQLSDELSQP